MKCCLLTFFVLLFSSSVFAEFRVDNYYPKSGVVGQNLNIQLDGKFGENVKAVLYPSKEAQSVIGSVKIPDSKFLHIGSIFVKNNIAYVSVYYGYEPNINNKTYIIDIRNKSNPKIIGRVDFFVFTMTDNYAVVILYQDDDKRVGIINIDEMMELNKITFLSINIEGCSIHRKNPCFFEKNDSLFYSYIDKNNNFFKIVDITDRLNPTVVASCPAAIDIYDNVGYNINIIANKAYVGFIGSNTSSNSDDDFCLPIDQHLQIIEISDFSNLKSIDYKDVIKNKQVCIDWAGYAIHFSLNITVNNDSVYLPSLDGLSIININNTFNAENTRFIDYKSSCYRVFVDQNYIYLITFNGIVKIDVRESANPILLGETFLDGRLAGAVVQNSTGYIIDDSTFEISFKIIDLNELSTPLNFGNTKLPDLAIKNIIHKDYAFVNCKNGILQIYDMFNSLSPQPIGTVHFPNELIHIEQLDDYEFIVVSDSNLKIIDLRNKLKLKITGVLYFDEKTIRSVAVSIENNRVFISHENDVSIVDVSNRSAPEDIGEIKINHIQSIQTKGDNLYIASDDIDIFNINGTDKTKSIGTIHNSDLCTEVCNHNSDLCTEVCNYNDGWSFSLIDDKIFIAKDIFDHKIFDISNYSNPKILKEQKSIPCPFLISKVSGHLLYSQILFYPIVVVYDIEDILNMKFICAINTFGAVADIQLYNDFAIIANATDGITTFPKPIFPQINRNTLNTLYLSIPYPKYPGNYRLRIYDDSLNIIDLPDTFSAVEQISNTSVEIPLTFKSPFSLSHIPDQVISPEIKEAQFSLSIKPTFSKTAIEDFTTFGHSGIQTRIPDKNISVSISNNNALVKIRPERHQYGSTPIHITVSDGHASRIETFGLTVKFPQICFQYDGIFNAPPATIDLTKSNHVMDVNGFAYQIDKDNHRIIKMNSKGIEIDKWGSYGSEIGLFNKPSDIAIDASGFVYVADTGNHRIQVLTSYGEFITLFGEYGQKPGQFDTPEALYIDDNDMLYVNDTNNHRIQSFQKVDYTEGKTQAIIIAGGGKGDNIWSAIQTCASFAYRTLMSQGLSSDDIFYLSSDTSADLKHDKMIDDYASNQTIEQAIIKCATKETGSLVIYMVDHGLTEAFKINEKEMLFASNLNKWLNRAQEIIPGKLIVIYDACHSASFLKPLSQYSPNRKRIVITSSAASEKSRFDARGAAAFSSHLWSAIFNGHDVKSSFESAKESITCINAYQTPHVDANGDGKANTLTDLNLIKNVIIGNGTFINSGIPLVKKIWITPGQMVSQGNGVHIHVSNIYSQNNISQVWAVITPPYNEKEFRQMDIKSMPSIELYKVSPKEYAGRYNGLTIQGTYRVAVFVRDDKGIVSKPALATIEVNNKLKRKAVIISSEYGNQAYRTLKFQGYRDDDIYYYSSNTHINGVDTTLDLNHIKLMFNDMYQIEKDHILDLVIYMAGNGDKKNFYLNENESLINKQMNEWLKQIKGMVTVIYDAPYSWNYLKSFHILDSEKRILISGSSNDQTAHFLMEGKISFSQFFWRMICSGKSVLNAQIFTKTALSFFSESQSSCIVSGRKRSTNYYIGNAYFPGSTTPVIESVIAERKQKDDSVVEISATLSTPSQLVQHVWAFVHDSQKTNDVSKFAITQLPHIELSVDPQNSSLYKGTCHGIDKTKSYSIGLYATNTDGNISLPVSTNLQ
jgi:hypothetical protein